MNFTENDIAAFQVLSNVLSLFGPGNRVLHYKWVFAEGKPARSVEAEQALADRGEYPVILILQDNRGAQDATTAVIEVLNPPPVAPPVCIFSIRANSRSNSVLQRINFVRFHGPGAEGGDELPLE